MHLELHLPRAAAVLLSLGVATLAACGPLEAPHAAPPAVRNVVWVIVDDLGWRDIGAAGSTFYRTPNIDRLATEGFYFTRFNAASGVCSPTRASFMTGKHPARARITNWIGGEQSGMLLQGEYRRQLPLAELTPGEAFRDAGFSTGYIGKWHLGDGEFLPDGQGFDVTIAVNGAGQPADYFHPYQGAQPSVWDVPDLADGSEGEDLTDGREGEYLTDRLTEEAIGFLRQHADDRFFLVLSHYAVHMPLQSKSDVAARYERRAQALAPAPAPFAPESNGAASKQRQDHAVYAGMIESTDDSVGRLLEALDELGLADSTAVVFVSDNGGLSTLPATRTTAPTSNAPLRAGKGWLYEGGIRVPMVVRWPGVDGARVEVPATSMDIYPTLLEMAGLASAPDQHLDGVSLVPLMTGSGGLERDSLFWHFPHYHGSANRPGGAVLDGDLKLIEWFEDGGVELYDLAVDPGETNDLAAARPDDAARLRELLHRWRLGVDAAMPTPNPQYRPRRAASSANGEWARDG